MVHDRGLSEPTTLEPDAAFEVLGNETRIDILRVLGRADEPLAFSDLYDRVDYDTTANFNYHLDRLEGHFVRKSDDGYELRQAGRRVVQAVLSGTVTDAPVLERTQVEYRCPHCDAPIEVRYHRERVELFCVECDGTWGADEPTYRGYLGRLSLPPAGFHGRTASEAVRAARNWQNLRGLAIGSGICFHCSAPLDRWVTLCEDHDHTDGVCDRCNRRYAGQFHFSCTNCIYSGQGTLSVAVTADTDFLAFLTARGFNPAGSTRVSEMLRVFDDYDEEVRSTDPFEAELTFSVDGDELTLTVDDDLSVVDATSDQTVETAQDEGKFTS